MQTFDSVCCDLVKSSNIVTVFSTYINIICTRQQAGVVLSLATLGPSPSPLSHLKPAFCLPSLFLTPQAVSSIPWGQSQGTGGNWLYLGWLPLTKVPELGSFSHSGHGLLKDKEPVLLGGGPKALVFRPDPQQAACALWSPRVSFLFLEREARWVRSWVPQFRKNMIQSQERSQEWVSHPLGRGERGKDGGKARRGMENRETQLRITLGIWSKQPSTGSS